MLQCTTAFEEARLLHPGDTGWFAVMRKLPSGRVMSRMHPMGHLDIVTSAVERAPDVYLSQSSFSTSKRRITSFASVRAAWVDIDCYSIERIADSSLIDEIIERCVNVGLPKPTYVIKSGRGLYAKWIFREEVGPSNLPVWNALQRSLCATFKAIGADAKSRDAARVLRIVGSINSKAPQQPVHMAWCNTDLVDFDHLCLAASQVHLEPGVRQDAKPPTASRLAQLRSADRARRDLADLVPSITHLDHLDHYAQTREPILLGAHEKSLRALHWRRFTDLRQLAHLRGGIHRGSRDNFMFWMMVSLANCGVVTRQNFFTELTDLSKSIVSEDYQPLHDGSMGSLFDRIGQHTARGNNAVYTPSNAKLIEILEITEEEQRHLSTLIAPGEKQRRADLRCPGRQQRREELQQARRLAMDLLAEGSTPAQAAAQAGVDRRQVYRWRHATLLQQQCPKATSRSGRALPVPARQAERGHVVGQVRDMLSRKISKSEICMTLGLGESAWYRICKSIRRCGLLDASMPDHADADVHHEKDPQNGQAPTEHSSRPSTTGGRSSPLEADNSKSAHMGARDTLRLQARLLNEHAIALLRRSQSLSRQAEWGQDSVSLQATLEVIKQRLRSKDRHFKPTDPGRDPRWCHGVQAGTPDSQSSPAAKNVLDLKRQAQLAREQAQQLLEQVKHLAIQTLAAVPFNGEVRSPSVRNLVTSSTRSTMAQVMKQCITGTGVHDGGAVTSHVDLSEGAPGIASKGPGRQAAQGTRPNANAACVGGTPSNDTARPLSCPTGLTRRRRR